MRRGDWSDSNQSDSFIQQINIQPKSQKHIGIQSTQ